MLRIRMAAPLLTLLWCTCLLGTARSDTNEFDTGIYNDSDSFLSSRSIAVASAILSGVFWNPVASAQIARSVTLLGVCRKASTGSVPLSQVMSVPLGNTSDPTSYYAGAAILNPCVMSAITFFGAGASLMFAAARGYDRRNAMSAARYPSFLVFPYLYLLTPSIMCAVTVLKVSSDTTMQLLSAMMWALWIIVSASICAMIYFSVPRCARFAVNFREEEQREYAKQQPAFLRLIQMREEAETEAQKRARELQQKEELQRVMDAMKASTKSLSDGHKTPTEGEEMRSTADAVDERNPLSLSMDAPRSEAEMPPTTVDVPLKWYQRTWEKIRRLTEGFYDDTVCKIARHPTDKEEESDRQASSTSAMQLELQAALLGGREKRRRGVFGTCNYVDAEDEARAIEVIGVAAFEYKRMLEQRLLSENVEDVRSLLIKVASGDDCWKDTPAHPGFVLRYGMLFSMYRARCYMFLAVEFAVSIICGVIEGWRPDSPSKASCQGQNITLFVTLLLYFAAVVTCVPYNSWFSNTIAAVVAFLQVISGLCNLAGSDDDDDLAAVVKYILVVGTIYIIGMRSLLDAWVCIVDLFFDAEEPWPTIALLSSQCEDVERTKVAPSLCNVSNGSVDADHDEPRKREPPKATSFCASRDIPESFHPFIQRPLKPRIPLPIRTEEEVRLRQLRRRRDERRNLWSEVAKRVEKNTQEELDKSKAPAEKEGKKTEALAGVWRDVVTQLSKTYIEEKERATPHSSSDYDVRRRQGDASGQCYSMRYGTQPPNPRKRAMQKLLFTTDRKKVAENSNRSAASPAAGCTGDGECRTPKTTTRSCSMRDRWFGY